MADSQTSSDHGTDPNAGTGDATVGEAQATDAAIASDQAQQVPSESQPSGSELDEFTRTVSAGGEKAVEIAKHFQRVASEKDSALSRYKPLEDLVARFGGGEVGAENARNFLLQYDAVMGNPQAKDAILHYLQTQEWRPNGRTDDLDTDFGEEPDPIRQELDELRRQIGTQNVRTATQDMKSHMASFFNQEMDEGVTLGEVLSQEQKAQIISGLENQIRGLGNNESGQRTLQNLTAETVQRMMQLQIPPKQWAKIGESAHLRKIEKKKGAATGVASTAGTTGNEGRAYSDDLATAVSEWAKDEGIDLYNLGGSRR
jgi:hypothetical protein